MASSLPASLNSLGRRVISYLQCLLIATKGCAELVLRDNQVRDRLGRPPWRLWLA